MVSIWVIPLAVIGLAISFYLYLVTHKQKKMVCIRGESCDAVVTSKYNTTFGVSNVVAGMGYYLLVIILAILILLKFWTVPLELILLIIATLAALFSIYLTVIQAFVLKIWCEYCLTSAAVSITIFVIELITYF